jgi:glycerol-3-phosphate dehydrogenase
MGLLDPATSDRRVIFFLPWQGNAIADTTDSPAVVKRQPRVQEADICWVLEEVHRYLSPDIKIRCRDVLSAWSGLRPLVRNPSAECGLLTCSKCKCRVQKVYILSTGIFIAQV